MKQLFNILALFLLMLFSNNIMSQSYSLYCVDDYFVNATECDLCDEYGSGRQFFNGLVLDARAAGKDILVRSPYDILVRGNTIILRDWTMNKVTINMSNIKNFSTPFSLLSYLKDCSGGTQQGGGGLSDGDYGDMTISGDGKIITLKNDIVGSDELQNTTVVAGTYNVANITVDAQGRITSASAATADLLPLATPLSGNNNVEAALVYLDNKPAADGSETKINAGTNVSSITGLGTIADPYVINVSSGTTTVGDGDYGDVVVSSGGTVWTVTGGGSTQVADLTALAASTFSIGTLVTVQNTGATYKIESSVPATWNSGTVDGTVALNDANSNVAFLQTINEGNLYLASHLGFDPTGVVDGGAKARTLMPLLSEYEHGIYWDDGATFLLKTRDKAGINGNPENANILSIDYDNFLWVGSGNEDTQAILDFRVADDIDNMNYADVFGLYFNMVTESINNFTIDGVHIRGDQVPVHNDNTDLFVRTIVYMISFKAPWSGNPVQRGVNWNILNNTFSEFHSFASINEKAIIDGINFNYNIYRNFGFGFNLGYQYRRLISESVTLNMPISSHTFSQIADVVHIRFHDDGKDYGLINYNTAVALMDTDKYGEITNYGNTEIVTWDISNATTDYTDATKVTVTIGVYQDQATINDSRLDNVPSNCIELPTSKNVEIIGNRFYDAGSAVGDHPIYLYRSCENLVIKDNIQYNTDDTRIINSGGITVRGAIYKNVVISNNILYNDGSHPLSIGAVDGLEMYGNGSITDFKCPNTEGRPLINFLSISKNVKAYNNYYMGVLHRGAATILNNTENVKIVNNRFENTIGIQIDKTVKNIELNGNYYKAATGQPFQYDLLITDGSNPNVNLMLRNEIFDFDDPVNHATNSIFAGFSGLTIKNPTFINEKQTLTLGNSSYPLTNSKIQGLNEYSYVSVSSNSSVLNLDSYTVTDNTPQTLDLSRSLSMNDLSVAGETVINREVTLTGAANTLNNNSTIYTNTTTLQTDAYTNKNFTNTNDVLMINTSQGFSLDGQIVNYNNLLNDRSSASTTNTTAADYTYQKDRAGATATNGVALKATANSRFGTITNAKALDINVTQENGTNTNAIGIQINDIQGTTQYAIKQDGTDDLNQFAGQVTIQNILNLQPILGANAPASPSEGDVIIVSDAITSPFDAAGMYLYIDGGWSRLSSGYTFSSLQTSNFTVALDEYNLVDPNGGAITATVPSGVTQVGTEFWVVDSEGTASGTNTITVDFSTNGYTVSGQNTAVINAAVGGFKFIYIGSNKFIKESL